jgi:enoyl-CoA hydratase
MTTGDALTIERRGRVAILSFNRPSVLNAFDGPLVEATTRAVSELGADEEVYAIVVRGHGRPTHPRGLAARARGGLRLHHGVLGLPQADDRRHPWLLHRRSVRIVACLRHHRCRGRNAARRAGSEVRLWPVAMLLPFVTGAKAAKEILLTGDDHLSAERALEFGIVNHVTPAGEELAKALAIAESIAAADPLAVQLSKRALNRSYDAMGMRNALAQALEADIFIEGAGSPKRAEFDRIRREQGLKAALAWRDGAG